MKKQIIILFIVGLLSNTLVYAQESFDEAYFDNETDPENQAIQTESIIPSQQNPFFPQVPKPVAKKPETKNPVKPKPQPTYTQPPQPILTPRISEPPTAATNFIITGIVWNTSRPQAIINGQVVDVGDKIQEYQIVSISKTAINLEYAGQTITVTP